MYKLETILNNFYSNKIQNYLTTHKTIEEQQLIHELFSHKHLEDEKKKFIDGKRKHPLPNMYQCKSEKITKYNFELAKPVIEVLKKFKELTAREIGLALHSHQSSNQISSILYHACQHGILEKECLAKRRGNRNAVHVYRLRKDYHEKF